jgi:Fe-S cluster assembly scaffold protein SufB
MNEYPDLIEKYLGSVIPIGDNYFAALNSAVLQMVRLFIFRKILFVLRSINIELMIQNLVSLKEH